MCIITKSRRHLCKGSMDKSNKRNNEEGFSGRNTQRKKISEPPTGVERMTSRYRLDALTTELWETSGEQGHILGSYTCGMCPTVNKNRQRKRHLSYNKVATFNFTRS